MSKMHLVVTIPLISKREPIKIVIYHTNALLTWYPKEKIEESKKHLE